MYILKLLKKNVAFIIFLLFYAYSHGQTKRLPPLFDDLQKTPVLHADEKPEDKIRNNIFVDVSVSKRTVFTGEPFLVIYKLYTALNSHSSVKQQPFFSGCSVKELTAGNEMYDEIINGKRYHVFIIRKVQLTPLQEGPLPLGTATVENIITFINSDDPYKIQNYTATLSNKPSSVDVNPLPEKNKPADFSGAVGQFTISAKADTNSTPAGENVHLQVIIQGTGNLQAINLPVINWPKNTEHFDASDTQYIPKIIFPVSGDKIFDIPFIGSKEGEAIIPPVYFSYFDPSTHTYKTIHTDNISILFTKAIPRKDELKNIVAEDITNRKYLWIVPAIAFTVAVIWFISSRKKIKNDTSVVNADHKITEVSVQSEFEIKPATNFPGELQTLTSLEDDHAFFILAKALLSQAIQEKYNTSFASETELIGVLNDNTKNTSLRQMVQYLYKKCNLAIYAPVSAPHNERAEVCSQLLLLFQQMGLV